MSRYIQRAACFLRAGLLSTGSGQGLAISRFLSKPHRAQPLCFDTVLFLDPSTDGEIRILGGLSLLSERCIGALSCLA
jgi:hypothetical protein